MITISIFYNKKSYPFYSRLVCLFFFSFGLPALGPFCCPGVRWWLASKNKANKNRRPYLTKKTVFLGNALELGAKQFSFSDEQHRDCPFVVRLFWSTVFSGPSLSGITSTFLWLRTIMRSHQILRTGQGKRGGIKMCRNYPVRIYCKRKQYVSVRSISLFLYPMVDKLLKISCKSNNGCSISSVCTYDGDPLKNDWKVFYDACEGTPPSLEHEGPISLQQIRSLLGISSKSVRFLVEFFVAQLPEIKAATTENDEDGPNLYPLETSLTKTLWPSWTTAAYVKHLREARASKVKCSAELCRDGYLQESGLHARNVFAPSVALSARIPLSSFPLRPAQGISSHGLDVAVQREAYWAALIDHYTLSLPDRSNVHELENLPQEIAIAEIVRTSVGKVAKSRCSIDKKKDEEVSFRLDRLVDVGGGNGFLAVAVSEGLGCDGVVVDPYFPHHSIDCCPRPWPDRPDKARLRQRRPRSFELHRRMCTFTDAPLWCHPPVPHQADLCRSKETDVWGEQRFVRAALQVPAASSQAQDVVFPNIALVAKHLCGTAVDECLRHVKQQCGDARDAWPAIVVLVPCCFHRCVYENYAHHDYLRNCLHIHGGSAFQTLAHLTALNKSVYQEVHQSSGNAENIKDAALDKKERSKTGVEADSSSSSGMPSACSKKSVYALIPAAEAIMESFEHLLNYGRQLWLRQNGYHTTYVEYVPRCVTPKNKCIVGLRY